LNLVLVPVLQTFVQVSRKYGGLGALARHEIVGLIIEDRSRQRQLGFGSLPLYFSEVSTPIAIGGYKRKAHAVVECWKFQKRILSKMPGRCKTHTLKYQYTAPDLDINATAYTDQPCQCPQAATRRQWSQ
jgi:hypothetical protein